MLGEFNNLWLNRFQRASPPLARLFCFAHAGGHSASFRQWPARLPDWVDVVCIQLPGRANRLRERPIASMDEMVTRLVSIMTPAFDLPFAFFGHSMGAIVAWAVARSLAETGNKLPQHLFLSGRRGPRVPNREPELSGLSDPEFVATMISRYGGIPDELLRHKDVMELLLPAMRADIAALEGFQPPPPARLPVPITALGGADDRMITRDDLMAWDAETSREFRLRLFPGGHFYLDKQRSELLAAITDFFRKSEGGGPARVGA